MPNDPTEITQTDSGTSPSPPSQPPSSPSRSVWAGALLSVTVVLSILFSWLAGKIQAPWWQVVGAMLVATLPTSDLAGLARIAFKGFAQRLSNGGK